ncbi:MAG TPA: hypothetical protein VF702_11405 [Allosphingosinicella sp.]|jgi:hypothetical protein
MKAKWIWPLRAAFALALIGAGAATLLASGTGGETIHYSYDARGRLVEVERVQPTVTVKTKYAHDRADNRTTKEVTTTP